MNQSNDIIRHIKVSSDLVVNGLKTCRITGDSLSATWRMFEGHLSQSQEANRSDDKGTFDWLEGGETKLRKLLDQEGQWRLLSFTLFAHQCTN